MNKKILFLFNCLFISFTIMAQNKNTADLYQSSWAKIDSLNNTGNPQSADKVAQEVYDKAKAKNQSVYQLKAQLYLLQTKIQYEENSDTAKIAFAEQELKSANYPLNALWHCIAAKYYQEYYNNNRWQILQRTQLAVTHSENIKEWDAIQFRKVISNHYLQSLKQAEDLKKIKLEDFDPLVTKGENTRQLRPTLFDLLAFEAIGYFNNDEKDITNPVYQFTLNTPDYLDEASLFKTKNITTKDSLSLHFHALQLYQELLKLHENDINPYIDADLNRLDFVYQHAAFQNKNEIYKKALKSLYSKYPDNAIAAEAQVKYLHLQIEGETINIEENTDENAEGNNPISSHQKHRNLPKIKEELTTIVTKFPNSKAAADAQNLINNMLIPALSTQMEEVILPNEINKFLIQYKNINKVFFKVVKLSEAEFLEINGRNNFDKINSNAEVALEWNVSLSKTEDYETHSTEIKMDQLHSGQYVLLVSDKNNFQQVNNSFMFTKFQVSAIAAVSVSNTHNLSGYILNRKTGEPIAAAELKCFTQEYSNNNYQTKLNETQISNTDGSFNFNNKKGNVIYTTINYQKATLIIHNSILGNEYYYNQRHEKQQQTFFFTDRSIYRPGQSVFFKGIIVENDESLHENQVVANKETEVILYDVNSQKIKSLQLKSNEYGSFSGSFVIPENGLTGSMHLQNDVNGYVYFNVEEYKRPKFAVSFDAIEKAYAINQNVVVTGKAMSFAGAPIDGAKVQYTVERKMRPIMWWYGYYRSNYDVRRGDGRRPNSSNSAQNLIHSETITNADGSFEISFLALPDPTDDSANLPIYDYTIHASVTDINGETRTGEKTISAGYKSIEIVAAIPSTLSLKELDSLSISTKNLNGHFISSLVNISITPLQTPELILRKRLWEQPEFPMMNEKEFRQNFPLDEYEKESDYHYWKESKDATLFKITTQENKPISFPRAAFKENSYYKIQFSTLDPISKIIITEKTFIKIDDGTLSTKNTEPLEIKNLQPAYEPNEKVAVALASRFSNIHLIQSLLKQNLPAEISLINLQNKLQKITQNITESDRGGMQYNWITIQENRVYQQSALINIPFTNKDLELTWATHRDKLLPGEKETWTITIKGNKKEKVAAEMLAGLYDASLDALKPHEWNKLNLYRNFEQFYFHANSIGHQFGISNSSYYQFNSGKEYINFNKTYDALFILNNEENNYRHRRVMSVKLEGMAYKAIPTNSSIHMSAMVGGGRKMSDSNNKMEDKNDNSNEPPTNESTNIPKTTPQLRKNLQETAFFFPDLKTDEEGNIKFSFTLPEALSEWKFMALAHTKTLSTGFLTGKIKTQKDLMVVPGLPRFFRQGDELILTTKINNLSNQLLNGTAKIEIVDPNTLLSLNKAFRIAETPVSFTAAKGESATASWAIHIPESRYEPVLVRIIAQSGNFSDGEENTLMVVTNRTFVTETQPMWINGSGSKNFTLPNLISSAQSKTNTPYRLTVEYTGNPAWYAVQALPYLMEYPFECAEQTFNRYYANALANYILEKSPKVAAIFNTWKNKDTAALLSNLEKNQELKSALLQETPWVMEAKNETQQKKNIALLFETHKLKHSLDKALQKLNELLLPEGAFGWFKGMYPDRYMTQYITTGIGRLQKLGINESAINSIANKTLPYLDKKIKEDYDDLIKHKIKLSEQNISYFEVQYLYLRSLFPNHKAANETAYNYYKTQAAKYWFNFNPYTKAMIALSLHRSGDEKNVNNIINSLRETALHNEEMGMYWKANAGYYWYDAPIESQALLIECFGEITQDTKTVDELKLWLLKQKQTQNWHTTRSTADACYALLLNSSQWLDNQPEVKVELGTQVISNTDLKTEAGTGYFKTAIPAEKITPEMGKIKLTVDQKTKDNNSASWGAVYYQYFENIDKVQAAGSSPLTLKKEMYVEKNGDRGAELVAITENTPLHIGDKVVIRIVLSADRTMEYVHLKDARGACFEPVNVLSGYRWKGGIGYYESTKDASSNFFIDHLQKGTYVFEYPVYVMMKGDFSNGMASIQCMYAPEFGSHSEGSRVIVK